MATGLSTFDASAQRPTREKITVSSTNKARAGDLFKRGADAYMRGEFAAAIGFLDEAYALDPQPVLVYNKARAHEGLGHTDEAIALYEQYLREEPSSPDRGAIEQRLSTLRRQQEERAAVERERAAVEQERAARAAAPPAASPAPPRKRSVLPYVVAGVGAAGLAAGGVFGLLAKSKEDDGNSAASQLAAIDARDTGTTFATLANVSWIAGGVLVAAGAVWWALDGGPRRANATRWWGLGGVF